MRTVNLHTAVFGKWANRTYYHTSYLTQPRALPNWLGLVSCAWKNCNFRQSLQVLISQGHYSSFVAVFNGLYENSEWHLWSNRNSTHLPRGGNVPFPALPKWNQGYSSVGPGKMISNTNQENPSGYSAQGEGKQIGTWLCKAVPDTFLWVLPGPRPCDKVYLEISANDCII